MTIDFLCRAYVRNEADETRTMITTTLDAMAAGGIHDQLGGGFARYSTDDAWLVPHFEKMLYDNALLTRAYLHGFLVTGESRYADLVDDIVSYVLRDLRDPAGGFYSAEDADSEGVEGKFYCWSIAEIREVCGADADAVIAYYGVTEGGNFADPHTGFRGNILHVAGWDAPGADRNAEAPVDVERSKSRLLARRATRVRPGLDDKVLLGWNALMLSALDRSRGGPRPRRLDGSGAGQRAVPLVGAALAPTAASCVRGARPTSRTRRTTPRCSKRCARWPSSTTSRGSRDARAVAAELIRLFGDADGGGFFTTGSDAEQLVVRLKDIFDDATPSANSLAANGLLRLRGTDRRHGPRDAGPRRAADARAERRRAPERVRPSSRRDRARGDEPGRDRDHRRPDDDPRTRALRREVTSRLIPASVTLTGSATDDSPLLAGREARGGAPTAYVCEHYTCRQPVGNATELRAQLDAVLASRRV